MSEFGLYFELGREHILDVGGYDHILFVMALCALYQLTEIKKVLILITAFTIGHSLTLALATKNWLTVDSDLVEFLIPVTILITAVSNVIKGPNRSLNEKMSINYIFAGVFGLIHGMGFSNYLQSLLGKDSNIITQLLAFNLGLELGQIIIVSVFLLLAFFATNVLGTSRKDWNQMISSGAAAVAITLMIDTKFW